MSDIVTDISRPHPDYSAMADWWMEGLDFYRGGVHVLQPGREVGTIYFYATSTSDNAGAPIEASAKATRGDYLATRTTSYLWSHERESKNRFNDRQRRLGHTPLYQPVVDIHSDAIMRQGPTINEGKLLQGPWKAIYSNADLRGNSLPIVARDALSWALACSRMHAVVDFPRLPAAPSTLAEQESWNLRPWISLVSPLEMINWSLDEIGRFQWLVLRELEPDYRKPGQPWQDRDYWYREWTTDEWRLYGRPRDAMGKKGPAQVVEEGYHGLGRVPVSTLWTDNDPGRTLFTQSPFASVQRMDRVVLNLFSLLHEIDYGQTFTSWFFPDQMQTMVGSLEMGVHSALTGPAAPVALSPDAQMAQGLYERIRGHIHLARVAAGVSRGQAEESKEARSGMAYAHENEQKHHQMARLAESTEEWLQDTLDICGLWMGKKAPSVSLPKSFDLRSLAQDINAALTIDKLKIGEKAMALIKKKVAVRALREHGSTEREVDEALAAIDAHTEELMKQPEQPAGPPMLPEDGARVRDEREEARP